MTSGIATYDDTPAWYADYTADPHTYFSPERLVDYVLDAPATSGYSYSNTNYVLAEMIIEKVTGDSYQDQLYRRIIEPLGLCDLYYRPDVHPASVTDREPAGYYFNHVFPLTQLLGRDSSRDTLSWARAAGAIVGTMSDLARWERALYGGRLLPAQQQSELESLISTATTQPIASTSATDPRGFGLGVAQVTNPELGTFWFYEGEGLAFRVVHAYFPDSGLIITLGLNSATESTNDQIGALTKTVYDTLDAAGLIHPRPVPSTPAGWPLGLRYRRRGFPQSRTLGRPRLWSVTPVGARPARASAAVCPLMGRSGTPAPGSSGGRLCDVPYAFCTQCRKDGVETPAGGGRRRGRAVIVQQGGTVRPKRAAS